MQSSDGSLSAVVPTGRDLLLGFFFVLLSSAFFCVQNIVVRILFAEQPFIGVGNIGGFLEPTLHNSFLLLWLRMVLAVPLMGVLATRLYPSLWKEVGSLFRRSQRHVLYHSIAGGLLMFCYLAQLYVAIGLIPTAIALTLFFTSPITAALLSWRFFGQKMSLTGWFIVGCILGGSVLTIPAEQWGGGSPLGVLLGVLSGATYACYIVNAQKSFEFQHPLTYTWISFLMTLLLSALCLLLWPIENPHQIDWSPLWIGSALSAAVTFVAQILYNLGIRQVGATSAAMIGSTNPILTVVLAWIVIQETLTGLQLIGIGIVTASVTALSRCK